MIQTILRVLFGEPGQRLNEPDREISLRICSLKGLSVDDGCVSISPNQDDSGESAFWSSVFTHIRLQGALEAHISYEFWQKLGRPLVGDYVAASCTCSKQAKALDRSFLQMLDCIAERLKPSKRTS